MPSIQIVNIGGIRDMGMGWNDSVYVIRGDEVGKTSMIRAMSVCLTTEQVFDSIMLGIKGRFVKIGESKALASFGMPMVSWSVDIDTDGHHVACRKATPTHQLFFASYGVIPGRAILHNRVAPIVDIESAIKGLWLESSQRNINIDRRINDVIDGVLGVRVARVSRDGIMMRVNGEMPIPLNCLPSSLLHPLGWLLDMLWRYHDMHDIGKCSVLFQYEMSGVVLVDDIDMYMSQQLTSRLVHRLAEEFPKMTFIVTAH